MVVCGVRISPVSTSDCCPFNATRYPFSVSSCWMERGRKQKPGYLWVGAARRQRGRGSFSLPQHPRGLRVHGKPTRTSAAASQPTAHPPAEGRRSNARGRVPARLPEGRCSPSHPPLRRPGLGVRRCSWGSGQTLGRCKARQDPNPRARAEGGSEPGQPSCGAKCRASQGAVRFTAPPGPGTALASRPSSGSKRPCGGTYLSMGSDWWRRARRASCPREQEPLWTLSGVPADGGDLSRLLEPHLWMRSRFTEPG